MLPATARQTVEILTPAMVSDHGEIAPDWSAPAARVSVENGCSWQPGGGSDDRVNRDGASVTGLLFMPSSAVVGKHDRIRIGGRVYVQVGLPEAWDSGLSLDHLVLRLERWDG